MEFEYFEINIAEQKSLPYLQGERSLSMIYIRKGSALKRGSFTFNEIRKLYAGNCIIDIWKCKVIVMQSVLSDCNHEKC